jgi:hypothetical protein
MKTHKDKHVAASFLKKTTDRLLGFFPKTPFSLNRKCKETLPQSDIALEY